MSGCRDTEIRVYEVPREKPKPVVVRGSEQAGPTLAWNKPGSWTEKAATSFRLGSYAAGDDGDAAVDISVTAFPDRAGGLLANINRWRGQIALLPIDEAGLDEEITEITIAGHPGSFVDMTGSSNESEASRIVVAIVSIEGKTWFFKMMGPAEAVGSELPAFRDMVLSAQAHDHGSSEDAR
jgi:hypothetical protein